MLDASLGEVRAALSGLRRVRGVDPTAHGKADRASGGVFRPGMLGGLCAGGGRWREDASVEGARRARAGYSRVRGSVVCVAGVDGVGSPVSETCHRPDRFAQLAGVSPRRGHTRGGAGGAARRGLHDVLLINKVEDYRRMAGGRRIALRCDTPVVAGSLWREFFGACGNPWRW